MLLTQDLNTLSIALRIFFVFKYYFSKRETITKKIMKNMTVRRDKSHFLNNPTCPSRSLQSARWARAHCGSRSAAGQPRSIFCRKELGFKGICFLINEYGLSFSMCIHFTRASCFVNWSRFWGPGKTISNIRFQFEQGELGFQLAAIVEHGENV